MEHIWIILIVSFIIGSMFGSFGTVLIERIKYKIPGIVSGRSQCPKCHHTLRSSDLIPLWSYIRSQGKCRYCKMSIPLWYLICEVIMGCIFLLITLILIGWSIPILSLTGLVWYFFAFVTGIYILSDLRHMEILDEIMVPAIWIALIWVVFCYLFPIHTFHTFPISQNSLIGGLLGAWALYTFFYLQILIPAGYHYITHKEYQNLRLLLGEYILFPLRLLTGREKDDQESDTGTVPTWIGGGDLRIAIFIGLTLGVTHGIIAVWGGYMVGAIIGVYLLVRDKEKRKNTEIPFGPFLGIGWLITLIFAPQIASWYNDILQYLFLI